MQRFQFITKHSLLFLITILLTSLILIGQSQQVVAQAPNLVHIDVPTAPVISFIYNDLQLEATTEDVDVDDSTWQYAVFSQEPNCQASGLSYQTASRNNRKLSLNVADIGKWYCFKVSNTHNLTGFAKFLVPAEAQVTLEQPVAPVINQTAEDQPLEIEVKQEATSLVARVIGDKKASWQVTLIANESVCSAANQAAFTRRGVVFASSQVGGLNWRDNGKHYCFRATASINDQTQIAYQGIKVSGLKRPAHAPTKIVDKRPQPQTEAPISQTKEKPTTPATPAPTETTETTETVAEAKNETDTKTKDQTLREVGIGLAVLGIFAIIVVLLISYKQDQDNLKTDQADDEEDDE